MKMKYRTPKEENKGSFVNFSHTTKKGSGSMYFLGTLGAFVYYMQQAENFWEVLVGFFKTFTWPAWLVYELLLSLGA